MTAAAVATPRPNLLMLRPTPEELEDARRAIWNRDWEVFLNLTEHHYAIGGSGQFSDFACKHCGRIFEQRTFGPGMRGAMAHAVIVNANRRMNTHLRGCKAYKHLVKKEQPL